MNSYTVHGIFWFYNSKAWEYYISVIQIFNLSFSKDNVIEEACSGTLLISLCLTYENVTAPLKVKAKSASMKHPLNDRTHTWAPVKNVAFTLVWMNAAESQTVVCLQHLVVSMENICSSSWVLMTISVKGWRNMYMRTSLFMKEKQYVYINLGMPSDAYLVVPIWK